MARVQILSGLGASDSALTIARSLDASNADVDTRVGVMRLSAGILGARGRVGDARAILGRVAALRVQAGRKDVALGAALDSAWLDGWLRGDVAHARVTVNRALAAHPLASMPHLVRPYSEIVQVLTLVGKTDQAKSVVSLFDRERQTVKRGNDVIWRITKRVVPKELVEQHKAHHVHFRKKR